MKSRAEQDCRRKAAMMIRVDLCIG
jgi:hypothetical protein